MLFVVIIFVENSQISYALDGEVQAIAKIIADVCEHEESEEIVVMSQIISQREASLSLNMPELIFKISDSYGFVRSYGRKAKMIHERLATEIPKLCKIKFGVILQQTTSIYAD